MRNLAFCLLSTLSISSFAQNNSVSLNELKSRFDDSFYRQRQRVNEYLTINKAPARFNDLEGNTIELIDVDEDGRPVYITTLNAGLALTTGVTTLRLTGSRGLDLKGAGMIAGIWDGGPVFQHLEFGDRNIFTEGGTISDHGTHVAGTILATGINIGAGGMAPLAKFYSYDWNSDRSEMVALAKPDETSLLFSNHSYGLVQGWVFQNNGWVWTGNPSISTIEDWRFGFYTNVARDLDQIAANAPYYSIFWAAGNDRDDTGGALYPADGNQGSGYDCLAQEGTAKNIFTIGAIQKIVNYDGPESVVMSSFSGWGPTDDGRIKPDLVAPGVGIFSTVSGNNYASFNGTSMATPGAMGSLMLVQELHKKLNGGKPMLSSTLKALAIHSAKEAGGFPGPDYSFGWGVVDVERASELLLQQDNQNIIISELELQQDETYELILTPKQNTKIIATIAWTDPAGVSPVPSLDPTDLMLVNDLDMRILSADQEVGFPWVLNPATPSLSDPATKGDNFRDNVEKIEFFSNQQEVYQLKISHKNQLLGGRQKFSLVLSYESISPAKTNYYWVGGSGEWSNPNNWSSISGGPGGFGVPNESSKVIFDEKSTVSGDQITISSNQNLNSLLWLNSKQATIITNLNNLIIKGDFIIASDSLEIEGEGKILFNGVENNVKRIGFSNNKLENITLILDENNQYQLSGSVTLDSIIVNRGDLKVKADTLNVSVVKVLNELSILDISNVVLNNVKHLELSSLIQLKSTGSQILPIADATIDFSDLVFDGIVKLDHPGVIVYGDNQISGIFAQETFTLNGSNVIHDIIISDGASLILSENSIQNLTGNVTLNSTPNAPIEIKTISGTASLLIEERQKLCFDNLKVFNVNILGEAVVNAGFNSQLTNALNWENDTCESVLFPNFSSDINCVGSLITLIDYSEGLVDQRTWIVPTSAELIETENGSTYLIAKEAGEIEISLRIENSSSSRQLTKSITIVENDLPVNTILINGNNLFSVINSTSYRWFKDFEQIPNALGRSYNFSGEPGLYFVLTESQGCNRISSEVLINSLLKASNEIKHYDFWPNPVETKFFLSNQVVSATLLSSSGVIVKAFKNDNDSSDEHQINECPPGIYVIEMLFKNGLVKREKLIVK